MKNLVKHRCKNELISRLLHVTSENDIFRCNYKLAAVGKKDKPKKHKRKIQTKQLHRESLGKSYEKRGTWCLRAQSYVFGNFKKRHIDLKSGFKW